MMKTCRSICKKILQKDPVLVIAWGLAFLSVFAVPIDWQYLNYFDVHTLLLLFCLMAVMAGMQNAGLFQLLGSYLTQKAKSTRQLEFLLVFLCFFSSMLITNDVALLTFVPLSFVALALAQQTQRLPAVVVLQTVAANLGSMLLPVGNPQNLYLYGKSGWGFGTFFLAMLPYAVLSAVLLAVLLSLRGSEAIENICMEQKVQLQRKKLMLHTLLFLLCLGVVLKLLPVWGVFSAVCIAVLCFDHTILRQVDYALLLTFCGFFVFVGNLGRIPVLNQLLSAGMQGNVVCTAALLSQAISNVPAALLLSGFTQQWKALLVGVNIGGLGTMIASMASLISYKFIAKTVPETKKSYFLLFTKLNFILLAFFLLFSAVWEKLL